MDLIQTPPGEDGEVNDIIDPNVVSRKSIISQINQIYNTISNTDSFRCIRQYCRGFKPNILLQLLIRLVSSLQEGLKLFPPDSPDQEDSPYYTPIDNFISLIKFDVKIQNINLFCSRMELGIQTLVSSSDKKKQNFISEINSCFLDLTCSCAELNTKDLNADKINNAISQLETLRNLIITFLSDTPQPPKSPRRTKKKKKSDAPKIYTTQEIFDKYIKSNPTNSSGTIIKSPSWTKQAQSYFENLEKNLHQLLYMFALKGEFEALSKSLHIFQDLINETNSFPDDDQCSSQTTKKKKRKRRKSEIESEVTDVKIESGINQKSPFEKKSPKTEEINEAVSFVKWAETNGIPPVKKRKKKRRSSSKSNDEYETAENDLEEAAVILPPRSVSQRHLRPYETIKILEMENKKLEELIRQCPHQPEEVKQLREENVALSKTLRSLTQELDELESMLRFEEEKFYEPDS